MLVLLFLVMRISLIFLWPLLTLVGSILMYQHHLPIISEYFIDTDAFVQIGALFIVIGATGGIIEAVRKKALFVRILIATWILVALSFAGLMKDWFCEGFGCLDWLLPYQIFLATGILLLFANAFAFYRLENKLK
jgi:hypothetical protein